MSHCDGSFHFTSESMTAIISAHAFVVQSVPSRFWYPKTLQHIVQTFTVNFAFSHK